MSDLYGRLRWWIYNLHRFHASPMHHRIDQTSNHTVKKTTNSLRATFYARPICMYIKYTSSQRNLLRSLEKFMKVLKNLWTFWKIYKSFENYIKVLKNSWTATYFQHCGKTFRRKWGLNIHISSAHADVVSSLLKQ